MTETSILWRRLDTPGHEAARLLNENSRWLLRGTAVFAQDGVPCRLDYWVLCDLSWQTISASVAGWVGDAPVEINLKVESRQRWLLNGAEIPQLAGCTDVDFGFSPSTNLLPVRRLGLEVGQAAPVKAAWLRFLSLNMEVLEQRYLRLGESLYRYESSGGSFVADLRVNPAGFVTLYPNLWQQESA